MGQYDAAIETAHSLISKFGKATVLREVQDRFLDVNKPWKTEPQNVDHPCVAVFLEYKQKEMDGSRVMMGDVKVLVAAKGVAITPTTQMKIMRDGQELTVVSVQPLKPADDAILYEMQARV